MNVSAAAQGIIAGLKPFTSGEARETLETIEQGLHTVEHGLRVVNGVFDTIERGLGIGRDVLAAFHQSGAGDPGPPAGATVSQPAGATVSQPATATPSQPAALKTAAERGAELLKSYKEDLLYAQMLAHHQAMSQRTQALLNVSRDRMASARSYNRRPNA